MPQLLGVVLPVFGLIGLGYCAGWLKLLGDHVGEGLSQFAFTLCIPALIFKTMASANLPKVLPWGYWSAYFAGAALVWALAMLISQRAFGKSHAESVIAGFCASQSNTVMLGIPLLLSAYGEAGAVPLFLLIAIHLPIMVTAATLLIEPRQGLDVVDLLRKLFTHPVLVGIFCGLAFRATGLPLTGMAKTMIDWLGAAAIPSALVALGLTLRHYGLRGDVGLAGVIASLKLIVHPGLVYFFATRIFPMPTAWVGVAVLFASMPSGVNSFLFSQRYKVAVGLASSTIALSTGIAVVSSLLWLWILGISGH